MSKYGILYQGSKNKIAEKIINLLPPADNFYDLFAGGCAIKSHKIAENLFITKNGSSIPAFRTLAV